MRSLSLSSAEVASSRMRMDGSRMMARAIATRCFWPPDMELPRSPTKVSKPWGSSEMKLYAFAARAAASISWRVGLVPCTAPYEMFLAMVVAKRTGSWPTRPMLLRSQVSCRSRMSLPSTVTEPPSGS
mmetsp:Transcript_11563/g.29325  ORF Transcript_11563/g.29325 Transcript_11563/m.29325 type:complete len:128 (-) Transcript_11563:411-794(-)